MRAKKCAPYTVKPALAVTRLSRKPALAVKIHWSQVILVLYEANKTRLSRNKTRFSRNFGKNDQLRMYLGAAYTRSFFQHVKTFFIDGNFLPRILLPCRALVYANVFVDRAQ